MADNVTLRSPDGRVTLIGDLVDVSGTTYVLRTQMGDLRIDSADVTCSGDGCPSLEAIEADIKMAGSASLANGLMPVLMEAFAAHSEAKATTHPTDHPRHAHMTLVGNLGFGEEIGTVSILSGMSSGGLEALRQGAVDLALTSRRATLAEAAEFRASGRGQILSADQERLIAVDSLVLIVHPDNPVQSVTEAQLRDIYDGEIRNWAELGGPNQPIRAVALSPDSATRAVFADHVLNGDVSMPAATDARDMQEAARLVNEDLGGIGFVGYAFQRGAKPIKVVNACGFSVEPDVFSARTGEYPLQRRMYLYSGADQEDPLTADFLAFATSPEADTAITKAGFIGFEVARKPQGPGSARWTKLTSSPVGFEQVSTLQTMRDGLPSFDRLSTTFRFRTGSSILDERARVDMERLIDYLSIEPAGSDIQLVGFTDSVGKFQNNLRLSQRRAAIVTQELGRVAGDRLSHLNITSVGYGEVAPSGCNLSEEGREINRRVEVWIRSGIPSSS